MNTYSCCDERRKAAIIGQTVLNGIDYLEVVDLEAPTFAQRQRILRLHFINSPAPAGITRDNVAISGGERVVGIQVDAVSYDGDVLVIEVDRAGDYSPYDLALVQGGGNAAPLPQLDPLVARVTFSFKVECPTDVDCASDHACPPEPLVTPEINYLAKDYEAFRRLMLDRMALLMPGWSESSAADLGVTVVEALAYVADHLSYQQDAVGTEAYLHTARRRISVRRHARLVDYCLHDGCNARVWVHLRVAGNNVAVPRGTALLTHCFEGVVRVPPGSELFEQALREGAEVFETLHDASLFEAHSRMEFYTWGALDCCLPKGATSATLRGKLEKLVAGDVLILVEERGARTGREEDADPSRRHAVRLTSVEMTSDPLGGSFEKPPLAGQVDVTTITWGAADALPFPLCISSTTDDAHGQHALEGVSVALGNVILADHGRSLQAESLGTVPEPRLFRAPRARAERCAPSEPIPVEPQFRPPLRHAVLTQTATVRRTRLVNGKALVESVPFDPGAPAVEATAWDMNDVFPAIELDSTGTTTGHWTAKRDLLDSQPNSKDFVVEVDDEGRVTLRFGDGEYGIRPAAGTAFMARYRIGNGTRGNVGASSIAHVVSNDSAIDGVDNPLPAVGGQDQEETEAARVAAPVAFRRLERAVTEEDWATVTERQPGVAHAAATFRWTGSWHTVFDTVKGEPGTGLDATFRRELKRSLERYRVVGRDLEVDAPRFVSLNVELRVCVMPDYFRSDVKRALLAIFNDRVRSDGRVGFFHQSRFTFGQTLYLSHYAAAAQAVEGVAEVVVTHFHRQGTPSNDALSKGFLKLQRLEIARIENSPDFPEHGVFQLDLRGGK